MTDPSRVPRAKVQWHRAARIIRTLYPPVDLFEDIADPADWPLLISAEMKTNPRLKVMVNGGYYDLATPFFAAQYEEKHLPIPASLAKNIEYDWYESGHMVYVRDESLKQLHDRVAAFITNTGKAGSN